MHAKWISVDDTLTARDAAAAPAASPPAAAPRRRTEEGGDLATPGGAIGAATAANALPAGGGTPRVAISSGNWSRSSVAKNREAGAVLGGAAAEPALAFMRQVYAADFALASPLVPRHFNKSSLATITNTSHVPVVVPPSPHPSGGADCHVARTYASPITLGALHVTRTPLTCRIDASCSRSVCRPQAGASVSVATSPDGAFAELTGMLRSATTTLEIYMYQVTDAVCDALADIAATGAVAVRILLSGRIFDDCDCEAARACYPRLAAAGAVLRRGSISCFNYAHQKMWVVDGGSVGWSTGNFGGTDFPKPTASPDVFPPCVTRSSLPRVAAMHRAPPSLQVRRSGLAQDQPRLLGLRAPRRQRGRRL